MIAHLEERLGARVQGITVQRVDHVNDATWVEVRFQLPRAADSVAAPPAAGPRSAPLAPPSPRSETDNVAAAGRNGHLRSGADR